MRTVQIFLSSPGDLAEERECISRVQTRLNGEFVGVAEFEIFRWEHARAYRSNETFQEQILAAIDPAACDIVLALFWSRLGTELPPEFSLRQADGSPYPSGSAFEVLRALEGDGKGHVPDVYVFRKTAVAMAPVGDMDAAEQKRKLDAFLTSFEDEQGRVHHPLTNFETVDVLRDLVTERLRHWVAEHVLDRRAKVWDISRSNPFPGLEAYDHRHANVYFGRARKVARAVDSLKEVARGPGKLPFLWIFGASGTGKSSLMRAGFAPRLTTRGVVNEVDSWRTATVQLAGSSDPFEVLAAALASEAGGDEAEMRYRALPEVMARPVETLDKLAEALARTPGIAASQLCAALDAVGAVEGLRAGYRRPHRTALLLLIDQMEALFGQDVTPATRDAFANLLIEFAKTGRVWIVATYRSDLYDRIAESALVQLKDAGSHYDLRSPGEDELREILDRIPRVLGLQWEFDKARQESLDERLFQDAAGGNMLPLLQAALHSLFEQREVRQGESVLTFEAYEKLGGLEGAIEQAGNAAIASLAEDPAAVRIGTDDSGKLAISGLREDPGMVRNVILRLFRELVAPVENTDHEGAGSLTVRRRPEAELIGDDPLKAKVVEALVAGRILLTERDGGDKGKAYVRIAHERILTSWAVARAAVKSNEKFYETKREVEKVFHSWVLTGRRNDALIHSGSQLRDALALVSVHRDELSPAERHFVELSRVRKAQLRWMRYAAVCSLVVLTLVSASAALLAFKSFYAAREGIKSTLAGTAKDLTDNVQIPIKTIAILLQFSKSNLDVIRAFNIDPQLKAIEAQFYYSIVETFQRVGTDEARQKAIGPAQQSLDLRIEFRGWYDGVWGLLGRIVDITPVEDTDAAIADSYEQVGDLAREIGELDRALEAFSRSFEIRSTLLERASGEDQATIDGRAVALSNSRIRLGDVYKSRGAGIDGSSASADRSANLRAALEHFRQAIALITPLVERSPGRVANLTEYAWTLKKIGQIAGDIAGLDAASPWLATRRQVFEKALCIRMVSTALAPDSHKAALDVAYSLQELALALPSTERAERSRLLKWALRERRALLLRANDTDTKSWYLELAQTLVHFAEEIEPDAGDIVVYAFYEESLGYLTDPAVNAEKDPRQAALLEKVRKRADALRPAPGTFSPQELQNNKKEFEERDVGSPPCAGVDLAAALAMPYVMPE